MICFLLWVGYHCVIVGKVSNSTVKLKAFSYFLDELLKGINILNVFILACTLFKIILLYHFYLK